MDCLNPDPDPTITCGNESPAPPRMRELCATPTSASVDTMQRQHRNLVHTQSFSVRVWLSAAQAPAPLVISPTSLSVAVNELG